MRERNLTTTWNSTISCESTVIFFPIIYLTTKCYEKINKTTSTICDNKQLEHGSVAELLKHFASDRKVLSSIPREGLKIANHC